MDTGAQILRCINAHLSGEPSLEDIKFVKQIISDEGISSSLRSLADSDIKPSEKLMVINLLQSNIRNFIQTWTPDNALELLQWCLETLSKNSSFFLSNLQLLSSYCHLISTIVALRECYDEYFSKNFYQELQQRFFSSSSELYAIGFQIYNFIGQEFTKSKNSTKYNYKDEALFAFFQYQLFPKLLNIDQGTDDSPEIICYLVEFGLQAFQSICKSKVDDLEPKDSSISTHWVLDYQVQFSLASNYFLIHPSNFTIFARLFHKFAQDSWNERFGNSSIRIRELSLSCLFNIISLTNSCPDKEVIISEYKTFFDEILQFIFQFPQFSIFKIGNTLSRFLEIITKLISRFKGEAEYFTQIQERLLVFLEQVLPFLNNTILTTNFFLNDPDVFFDGISFVSQLSLLIMDFFSSIDSFRSFNEYFRAKNEYKNTNSSVFSQSPFLLLISRKIIENISETFFASISAIGQALNENYEEASSHLYLFESQSYLNNFKFLKDIIEINYLEIGEKLFQIFIAKKDSFLQQHSFENEVSLSFLINVLSVCFPCQFIKTKNSYSKNFKGYSLIHLFISEENTESEINQELTSIFSNNMNEERECFKRRKRIFELDSKIFENLLSLFVKCQPSLLEAPDKLRNIRNPEALEHGVLAKSIISFIDSFSKVKENDIQLLGIAELHNFFSPQENNLRLPEIKQIIERYRFNQPNKSISIDKEILISFFLETIYNILVTYSNRRDIFRLIEEIIQKHFSFFSNTFYRPPIFDLFIKSSYQNQPPFFFRLENVEFRLIYQKFCFNLLFDQETIDAQTISSLIHLFSSKIDETMKKVEPLSMISLLLDLTTLLQAKNSYLYLYPWFFQTQLSKFEKIAPELVQYPFIFPHYFEFFLAIRDFCQGFLVEKYLYNSQQPDCILLVKSMSLFIMPFLKQILISGALDQLDLFSSSLQKVFQIIAIVIDESESSFINFKAIKFYKDPVIINIIQGLVQVILKLEINNIFLYPPLADKIVFLFCKLCTFDFLDLLKVNNGFNVLLQVIKKSLEFSSIETTSDHQNQLMEAFSTCLEKYNGTPELNQIKISSEEMLKSVILKISENLISTPSEKFFLKIFKNFCLFSQETLPALLHHLLTFFTNEEARNLYTTNVDQLLTIYSSTYPDFSLSEQKLRDVLEIVKKIPFKFHIV